MSHPTALASPWILPLTSDQANLQTAGGKGANLSVLFRAGFPVPDGFLVTTQAYRDFVAANHLEEAILARLQAVQGDDPEILETVSSQIHALFTAGHMPGGLEGELRGAYRQLTGQLSQAKAVAVRSSATAEDLPEMSFAGQQDTYLNVLGVEDFLKAVVSCWSSLWTGRAIGYRRRSGVPHEGAALAVVVQKMVESEAAGVMFTANPFSGLRTEIVIDATLGLGEALVSGRVEPDHYVVAAPDNRIVSKVLGAKAVSIHGLAGGGTHTRQQNRGQVQALPDEQILALAQLGKRVAELYHFPQDIEWAYADSRLFLLQARPVTALFPVPDGFQPEPIQVFFSFGSVQGMLDPITPLGRDGIFEIMAAGARMFGVPADRNTQSVLYVAGERLWSNFTPVLSNSIGRRVIPVIFSLIDPAAREAIEQVWDDPRLQPVKPGIRLQTRARMVRFFLPIAGNVLLNILAPQRRRAYIIAQGESALQALAKRNEAIEGNRWQKLAQQADLLPGLTRKEFPTVFRLFISGVAAGAATWNLLNSLADGAAKNQAGLTPQALHDLVLQVTRGMPNNPTTEMDLNLWEIAKMIRRDPASCQAFQDYTVDELSTRYQVGSLPSVVMQAIGQFLERYGGRGLAEIDLGRERWADNPAPVFDALSGYLKIEEDDKAPDIIFARASRLAQEAVDQLTMVVRKTRFGWIKRKLVRFFAGRARHLMGMRENPKFFAVRMMWIIQKALVKTGQEFVQAGELEHPDDLFYLTFDELKELASQAEKDWRSLIAQRRSAYQREMQRKQIPRLLISDGRAFYEGVAAATLSGNELMGSPVSPGIVEGKVRVVFNPAQAGFHPGEILVCPGTDPSWTPLFLSAAGLIMEVGGMMTHGAVVAREYGIPAVVGVDRATSRLKTGQRIRLNGSSGQITFLEDES
jgi:pyruvate,water dikinase